MLIQDFESGGSPMIAALANWVFGQEKNSASGGDAVVRVSQWFYAYCRQRPATACNIQWQSLDGLRTCMRNFGPNVSDADLDATIEALPSTIVGQQAQIQAIGQGWGS